VNPGPNSHFFTVNVTECNALKDLQITPRPTDAQQWNYEGIAYLATPPVLVDGALGCRAGTLPLYRAYNNAYPPNGPKNPWDSNHRFTPQVSDIAALVAGGWRNEGIVFCTAQWRLSSFTYNATFGFFDANGDPLFTACGKATATRFE
jgi:hypothetical protein